MSYRTFFLRVFSAVAVVSLLPAVSSAGLLYMGMYSLKTDVESGHSDSYIKRAADAGFNVLGPHYDTSIAEQTERTLEAHAVGGKNVWYLPQYSGLTGVTVANRAQVLTDVLANATQRQALIDEVTTNVQTVLGNSQLNSTVVQWGQRPEEMRHWIPAEREYTRIVSEAVRAADSMNRPIWQYAPNHRKTSDLVALAVDSTDGYKRLDKVVMGVYATDTPSDQRGARVQWGLNQMLEAGRLTSSEVYPVFQLSEDYPGLGAGDAAQIKSLIRHDVYLGLVNGIDGFQVWSGFHNRQGLDTFSEQFEGYLSVAEDMTGSLALADVFTDGVDVDNILATQTDGTLTISWDDPAIGSLQDMASISTREIVLDSQNYLFVVNSSDVDATVLLSGFTPEQSIFDIFSSQSWMSDTNGQLSFQMSGSQVSGFRFTAVPEPTSLATFLLAGATIVFTRRRRIYSC